MMKKLLISVAILMIVLQTVAFAYRWEEYAGNWYVYDETEEKLLTSVLLDTGDGVYYLDEEGKLVTGWWKNNNTNKTYFFDNKETESSYGNMLFGLHMIDGYYHYFGDDGSLETSEKKDTFRKVYGEFYADSEGYLYYDNVLMRDTSIAKSEYYTNKMYYTNVNLNNYYLANYDVTANVNKPSEEITSNINVDLAVTETKKSADQHKTSGGLNYTVDDEGHVHTYGDIFETKPAEKYGPMNIR